MKKSILLLVLAVVLSFSVYSQKQIESSNGFNSHGNSLFSKNRVVKNLKGNWKFKIGDKKEWSSAFFNDTMWDNLWVPMNWEAQGYNGYDGYAWYRKTIVISNVNDQDKLFFEASHIDDVDEVYFNGILIGSNGGYQPNYFTAWSVFRRYPIPSNLIKVGKKNIIAIKVYDDKGPGGITFGEIAITKINRINFVKELNGNWLVSNQDHSNYKNVEVDTKDWQSIVLPNSNKTSNAIRWYRKIFDLPNNYLKTGKYVVILGKIVDHDKTYLNGVLIGKTWDEDKSRFYGPGDYDRNVFRAYYIDAKLLKLKDNKLSIRVKGVLGLYSGPIGIMDQESYSILWTDYKQSKYFEEEKKERIKSGNHDREYIRSLSGH